MDQSPTNHQLEKKEVIELINLTAKYSSQCLTDEEHDRLDELITGSDLHMRLFETLSEGSLKEPMQKVADSL